jgi:ABC-type nitrate/sulfonate/bicarbonate transport system substrate-binding protein
LLGALTSGFVNDIIVSKSFEQQAHLTATSTLAEKVKALVGKRIGTTGPGTGTEALAIYLFKLFGYDAKRDATLVNVGSSNSAPLAALSAGRVDAVSFFPPVGQEAEIQGLGNIFISPVRGDIPAMTGQVHCIFYTMQKVIDAKPKAVQAFVRAIAQAEAFIHQNQPQALLLLQKDLKLDSQTTKAVFAATLPVIPASPQISQQGYDTATQFHLQTGLIKQSLPYTSLVAASTINSALSGLPTS